jgi:type I restriction enzyme S subunit
MNRERIKLGKCISFISRGMSPKYLELSEIKVLNQRAIRWGYIDEKQLKYHDSIKKVRDEIFIKKNDIVLNSTGDITIGRAYYFKDTPDNMFPDSHVTIIRTNPNKLLPDFLIQLFPLEQTQSKIYNLVTGATGQLELSKTKICELVFDIPPLPTQRKIASILSAYDDLIENNLKRIKLLEEKAQLHYKELMQEMHFTKTKREEYIKDCLSFYIGGGWGEEEYKEKFTEPAYVIRGTDIPKVRKGDIKNVPFRYHKESNLASRKLEAGDIIFEVSGGSKGQPVGRCLMITEKLVNQFVDPVMCASFCKLLRTNDKITPEYFYCYLLAGYENGVIAQYEKHSASNIVNYGFEEFIKEQKIKIPKDFDLSSFTEKVKPIFTLVATLGEQNSKLKEARDILLPRLMSGEIEV